MLYKYFALEFHYAIYDLGGIFLDDDFFAGCHMYRRVRVALHVAHQVGVYVNICAIKLG